MTCSSIPINPNPRLLWFVTCAQNAKLRTTPRRCPRTCKRSYQSAARKNWGIGVRIPLSYLVGGWTNPFETYARQNGFIFPKIGMKIKNYLKPPPRYLVQSKFETKTMPLATPKLSTEIETRLYTMAVLTSVAKKRLNLIFRWQEMPENSSGIQKEHQIWSTVFNILIEILLHSIWLILMVNLGRIYHISGSYGIWVELFQKQATFKRNRTGDHERAQNAHKMHVNPSKPLANAGTQPSGRHCSNTQKSSAWQKAKKKTKLKKNKEPKKQTKTKKQKKTKPWGSSSR